MDFLIYYETVQREYENACLLKAELERRGYSVKLCATAFTDHWKRFFYTSKVSIVHGFYGDNPQRITKFKKTVTAKVINLQYEQFLEMDEKGLPSVRPEGDCKKAYHICWGKAGADNLRKCGVEEDHILECGPIQFDLVREDFSGYFYSKEELGKQFGLDSEKKWVMFISDFANTSFDGEIIRTSGDYIINEWVEYESKASRLLMRYIQKFIAVHPEIIYIYRPHPSEGIKKELYELEEKYTNFKCIRNYSIKQWIYVVDKLNTWNSTAIAEAYIGRKNCVVIDIAENEMIEEYWNWKIDIIDPSKTIHTYEEFEFENLNNYEFDLKHFPIDLNQFKLYYGTAWEKEPIYLQLCDLFEKIYKDDNCLEKFTNHKYEEIKKLIMFSFKWSLREKILLYIFPIVNRIFPTKCKPDERHILYDHKRLKEIQNRIKRYVLEISPKYRKCNRK